MSRRSPVLAIGGGALLRTLFSFRGRIKRLDYLLASLGLAVGHVAALVGALAVTRGKMDDETGFIVRAVLDAGLFWPSAAIVIKRGHDRDRPTAYSALLITLVYGVGVAIGYLIDAGHQQAGGYCTLIIMLAWPYMFIDYGLIDGTKGPNRYGPSPKGHQAPGVGAQVAAVFD